MELCVCVCVGMDGQAGYPSGHRRDEQRRDARLSVPAAGGREGACCHAPPDARRQGSALLQSS